MTINKVRSKSKPAIDLMLFNKEATRLLSDVQCLKQKTNDINEPSATQPETRKSAAGLLLCSNRIACSGLMITSLLQVVSSLIVKTF